MVVVWYEEETDALEERDCGETRRILGGRRGIGAGGEVVDSSGSVFELWNNCREGISGVVEEATEKATFGGAAADSRECRGTGADDLREAGASLGRNKLGSGGHLVKALAAAWRCAAEYVRVMCGWGRREED